MNREIKNVLKQMLWELKSNHLTVRLIPQLNPTNPGACIRVVTSRNCQWYRDFCSEFESNRKTRSKKFKTGIKRADTIRILEKMIAESSLQSKYCKRLIEYAGNEVEYIPNTFLRKIG